MGKREMRRLMKRFEDGAMFIDGEDRFFITIWETFPLTPGKCRVTFEKEGAPGNGIKEYLK
jgi:hypothetical protein